MEEISIVGIDLAKNVFQVHGATSEGKPVFSRKFRRAKLLAFMSDTPECMVAMEACASFHHWGREIGMLGHTVKLIPPVYVKPYVKRQCSPSAFMRQRFDFS